MSENLFVINFVVIIFYLLVEKFRIDSEIKKYVLYPLRISLVLLAIVDLLVLFNVIF